MDIWIKLFGLKFIHSKVPSSEEFFVLASKFLMERLGQLWIVATPWPSILPHLPILYCIPRHFLELLSTCFSFGLNLSYNLWIKHVETDNLLIFKSGQTFYQLQFFDILNILYVSSSRSSLRYQSLFKFQRYRD